MIEGFREANRYSPGENLRYTERAPSLGLSLGHGSARSSA